MPDRQSRKKAQRLGHRAELMAALALILKRYWLIERRYKTPVGEVDLIMRKGDLIVFVEVKARKNERFALDAISYDAQKRITAAGDWWLSKQPDFAKLSWRYDVVAVLPWSLPRHFKDVW